MDGLIELAGIWLARAYVLYGMAFLLIPSVFFVNLALLAAVIWTAASHSRGRQPWPSVPAFMRRWVRLALEIGFGLINPVLYLAIFKPALSTLRSGADWWLVPLTTIAWILLTVFWTMRVFGAAFDPRSRALRAGVRALLMAGLACLLVYTIKDAWLLAVTEWNKTSPFTFALNFLRLCPLYLIPAVLLWDYLLSTSTPSEQAASRHGLFLLPDRAARVAVAGVVGVALVTFAFTAHRRSDSAVRRLVSDHRDFIRAAAARYDVDPRLIASIVYVTHRDQLSPFRGALERLVISAWGKNMRGDLGLGPPDRMDELGTDENPLLNRSLDISVGLAQIKPRTAQTASVLATGHKPDDLPKPAFYSYRDVEPLPGEWTLPAAARTSVTSPIPVPAERHTVANALLDAQSNLAMCALILAIYQSQWEAANPDWGLRGRPDILATLYQIGFARSKPHGAPQSNAFGRRVRQVYEQPWLGALLDTTPRPPG
jgi:hypothetical protein